MKYYDELLHYRITDQPVVFSLGGFDGVHLGHQHLLSLGRQVARERGALFSVLTFSTPPRCLFHPKEPILLLASPYHKRKLLENAGVDLLIETPFSEEIKALSAEQFLASLSHMVDIDTWVAGVDLQFGRNRTGTCAFLREVSVRTGLKTVFIDRITVSQENLSSSSIRSLIQSGNIARATKFLGRPFSLVTEVLHPQERDSCVFLDVSQLCLPPNGVYAVTIVCEHKKVSCDGFLHVEGNDEQKTCRVCVQDQTACVDGFVEVILLRKIDS